MAFIRISYLLNEYVVVVAVFLRSPRVDFLVFFYRSSTWKEVGSDTARVGTPVNLILLCRTLSEYMAYYELLLSIYFLITKYLSSLLADLLAIIQAVLVLSQLTCHDHAVQHYLSLQSQEQDSSYERSLV